MYSPHISWRRRALATVTSIVTIVGSLLPSMTLLTFVPVQAAVADMPVVPMIDSAMKTRLRTIYTAGQSQGQRSGVFAKVGDSITATGSFLADIGCAAESAESPLPYGSLNSVVRAFNTIALAGESGTYCDPRHNSFNHPSPAAASGWTADRSLTVGEAESRACTAQETPLACEYRLTRPALSLIMVGTNDAEQMHNGVLTVAVYKSRVMNIVDQTLSRNIIPVLSTIPPRLDISGISNHVAAINQALLEIAQERQIPLWNYWRAMNDLGAINNYGISSDGIHPSVYRSDEGTDFSEAGLRNGYNLRNYTALQVLAKMKAVILDNGPADTGTSASQTSTQQTAPPPAAGSTQTTAQTSQTSPTTQTTQTTQTAPVTQAPAQTQTTTQTAQTVTPGTTTNVRVYIAGESIERRNRYNTAPFAASGSLNNPQDDNDDEYGWAVPFADRLHIRQTNLNVVFVGTSPWMDAEDSRESSGAYPPAGVARRTSAISGTSVEDWLDQRRSELAAKTHCYDVAFAARGGNDWGVSNQTYQAQLAELVRLLDAGSSCRQHPLIYVTGHMPDSQGTIAQQRALFVDRVQAVVSGMNNGTAPYLASDRNITVRFIDMNTPFAQNVATTAFPSPSWTSSATAFNMAKIGRDGDGLHPRRQASIYAGEIAANGVGLNELNGLLGTSAVSGSNGTSQTTQTTQTVTQTAPPAGSTGQAQTSQTQTTSQTTAQTQASTQTSTQTTAQTSNQQTVAQTTTQTQAPASTQSTPATTAPSSPATTRQTSVTVTQPPVTQRPSAPTTERTFNLSLNPTTLTLMRGRAARATVNIVRSNGFNNAVRFSFRGLPRNARASFSPLRTTRNASAFTITTTASTPIGTYPIVIRGIGGTVTRTVNLQLIVTSPAPAQNFTLSLNPASLTVQQGEEATFDAAIVRQNGFSGAVNISSAGPMTGIEIDPAVIARGESTTPITIFVDESVAPGQRTINVRGASGSLQKNAPLTLNVTARPSEAAADVPETVTTTPPATTPTTPPATPTGPIAPPVTVTPAPPVTPPAATIMSTRRYEIGDIVTRDIWVDPTSGNDERDGSSRAQALRTLTAAWQLIPQSQALAGTGYRIMITRGTLAEAAIPGYLENRLGTQRFPIILQAADGRGTTTLGGDLNIFNTKYLYLVDLNIVPSNGGDALHCEQCDHLLMRGMTLRSVRSGASSARETIKINQSSQIYIEDSDISGASDNAIDYVSVQYGHVINSKIHNAEDWCAYAKGGSAYIWYEGNEFYDCGTGGFTAGQGTGFEYMISPWLHYEAYGITFVNNIIHDIDGAGIGVNGGYNIVMAHNTMYRVGRRDHAIEIVFGERSCDGGTAACQRNLTAGGWGLVSGDPVYIGNKNVYIYNNVISNPAGYQSLYTHFAIYSPRSPRTGTNVPSPAKTDDNLNIKGNIIWNGTGSMSLGIEEQEACLNSNATCNAAQLRRDNKINDSAFQPTLMNPSTGDFRPAAGSGIAAFAAVPLPILSWSDLPARPQAYPGYTNITVLQNRAGQTRSGTGNVGAY